uniref:Serologically defined colon cancer antigen 8 n=1 Tax=Cyprinus carpio TaxID=7962 RepID=A0A8C2ILD4_CYPCA
IKQRVRVVIVEDEKLHEELKAKAVEETLKEYTFVDSTVRILEVFSYDNQSVIIYAYCNNMPSYCTCLCRKDLVSVQKEYNKEAMAVATSSGQRVGGLCLKCAQHEAILAETHSNVHVQNACVCVFVRERDELMTVLCSLRAGQTEAQQREWATYQQVKQAVEMAEEANLEKTRALVQCEHFHNELTRQRERLERELASEQEKISQAREAACLESKKEKEVTSLSQRVAEFEGLLERGERDRNSLNGQLEEAYKKLTAQETDSSKGSDQETCLKTLILQFRMVTLVAQKSHTLLLNLARASCTSLIYMCIHLIFCSLSLCRQEKKAVEHCCGEDMAALTFQAQRHERELTQTLQQMEAQHERSGGYALLSCQAIGAKLEKLARSTEIEQLSLEKEHLQESAEKLRGRCEEMGEQCVQHGRIHQRMKQRLQQLDQHCQASSQQVLQLLSRQKQLMQERQQLAHDTHNL